MRVQAGSEYLKISKQPKSRLGGFTLLEVVVALVILGVLVAIAGPRIPYSRSRARQSDFRRDAPRLAQELSRVRKESGQWPTPTTRTIPESFTPAYFGHAPAYPAIPPEFAGTADLRDPFLRSEKIHLRWAADGDELLIASAGPDADWDYDIAKFRAGHDGSRPAICDRTYDPTNGTFSSGDLLYFAKK